MPYYSRNYNGEFHSKSHRKQWRKAVIKLKSLSHLVNAKAVKVWHKWFICDYTIWYDNNGMMYHYYANGLRHRDQLPVAKLFAAVNWNHIDNDHYFVIEDPWKKN